MRWPEEYVENGDQGDDSVPALYSAGVDDDFPI